MLNDSFSKHWWWLMWLADTLFGENHVFQTVLLRMRADSSWSTGTVTTVRFGQSGWTKTMNVHIVFVEKRLLGFYYFFFTNLLFFVSPTLRWCRMPAQWPCCRQQLTKRVVSVFFGLSYVLLWCVFVRFDGLNVLSCREPTCHLRLPSQGVKLQDESPHESAVTASGIPKCSVEATCGIGRRWSALSHCRSLLHLALWAACDSYGV